MRFLLDTHTFLWWTTDASALSTKAHKCITNPHHDHFLSVASCWEMAIKSSLGKLRLTQPVDRFVAEQIADCGFQLLAIEFGHVAKVEKLTFHHRDPFDRLLVAQALVEELTVVTADPFFGKYGVEVLW